ncbi:MAG TPA: HAD family hydrolase [Rhizobiaceae bacterium]|nr:HAD family hydrolase [Rhizobiaceae bacterium]
MTDALFSGRAFDGFLFDMDGTILSSIRATERCWGAWATRHGLDVPTFIPTIHGVRAKEVIRALNLPGVDIEAEARALLVAEMADMGGIEAIPGAAAFLTSLPANRWSVVTSAPRKLAEMRIDAAGLPQPPMMVTAEDVKDGKPAPDCFLLGAERLGFDPRNCLVFEDAPAGIQAGEAAGASVVVITATHPHGEGLGHLTLDSYDGVRVHVDTAGRLQLTVEQVPVREIA